MEVFKGYFPYLPLPARSKLLRLVSLKPGQFDSEIICTLTIVNGNNMPVYEALSYTWGDPNETTSILLNGRDFQVTTSLSTALRYLRYENAPRLLWIDAICINQKDVKERNDQIQKIMHIYNSAFRTIIWLGVEVDVSLPENQDKLSVKEVFRGLEKLVTEHNINHIKDFFPGTPEIKVANSLLDFYTRPWFGRRWVIQEFAMSDGKTSEFLCGKESISIGIPLMAYFHLYRLQTAVTPAEVFEPVMKNLRKMFHCSGFRFGWETSATTATELADRIFEAMIWTDGAFNATDIRDHFYSMLGIVNSSDFLLQFPLLRPDYTKPASQVFTELARFLIERRQLLDVFYGYNDPACGTPSWAPTWGKLESGSKVYVGPRFAHLKDYMEQKCIQKAQFSFLDDSRTLLARGVMVGKVGLTVGSDSEEISGVDFNELAWRNLLQRWEDRIISYLRNISHFESSSDESLLEMWKDVLLHRSLEANLDQILGWKILYECLLGRFYSYLLKMDPQILPKGIKEMYHALCQIDANDIFDELRLPLNSLLIRLTSITLTSSAFVTETGIIGLTDGGNILHEGDILCVFPGLSTPFIIHSRESQDGFTLVGPCYVHGLMKPEEQSTVVSQGRLEQFAIL